MESDDSTLHGINLGLLSILQIYSRVDKCKEPHGSWFFAILWEACSALMRALASRIVDLDLVPYGLVRCELRIGRAGHG